jgi:thioredoxin 1
MKSLSRIFLALIIILSCGAAALFADGNLLTLTDADFDERAKDSLLIVDFYADWCGPCVAFAPVFEKTASRLGNLTFVKVNVDNSPKLSQTYKVQYIPFIAAIVDGEVVAQYSGKRTAADFKKWCQEMGEKHVRQDEPADTTDGQEGVVEVTDETMFTSMVNESRDRLLVIDFYADWCKPCKELEPIMESLAATYSDRNVAFLKADIDTLDNLANLWNVQYIPYVVLVRGGSIIDTRTGLYDESDYIDLIEANIVEGGTDVAIEKKQEPERSASAFILEVESQEQFFKMLDRPGVHVADFYADWCGPCRRIAPIMKELSSELPNVHFYKIDIDTQRQLAATYYIDKIPVIYVFAKNDKPVKIVGVRNKGYYLEEINKARARLDIEKNDPEKMGNLVLDLSKRDAWVSTPDSELLRPVSEITVEAMIRPEWFEDLDWKNPVVSKHGNASGWELRVGGGKAVMMVTVNGKHHYAMSKQDLPRGRWTHVSGSFDGRFLRVYIEGKLQGETEITGGAPMTPFMGDLNIGRNPEWTDRVYSGHIDEVRVWNRAFSPGAMRKSKKNKIDPSDPALLLHYDFSFVSDDGTVPDRSSYGLEGTLQGGAGITPITQIEDRGLIGTGRAVGVKDAQPVK